MKSAKQIAFLNLLFIVINCFWIIIIDDKKVYGLSIYETFSTNWSYLTPHISTFNIWKVITIGLVLTAVFYCILLKRESEEDAPLAQQIEKSGNWMIINQLFLGMSMVFKVNNYLLIAYLCSLVTYYSLVKLNMIFSIRDVDNPTYIHIFTRTSLGLYSGWFVYLLGFNGVPTLNKILRLPADHDILFYLALIFVLTSFGFIWYKAMLCKLPAILVGYSTGILGSYYYNMQSEISNLNHTMMRYTFVLILFWSICTVVYLIYKKRKFYLMQD
jgi:hypothetical protein